MDGCVLQIRGLRGAARFDTAGEEGGVEDALFLDEAGGAGGAGKGFGLGVGLGGGYAREEGDEGGLSGGRVWRVRDGSGRGGGGRKGRGRGGGEGYAAGANFVGFREAVEGEEGEGGAVVSFGIAGGDGQDVGCVVQDGAVVSW